MPSRMPSVAIRLQIQINLPAAVSCTGVRRAVLPIAFGTDQVGERLLFAGTRQHAFCCRQLHVLGAFAANQAFVDHQGFLRFPVGN